MEDKVKLAEKVKAKAIAEANKAKGDYMKLMKEEEDNKKKELAKSKPPKDKKALQLQTKKSKKKFNSKEKEQIKGIPITLETAYGKALEDFQDADGSYVGDLKLSKDQLT